MIRVNDPVVVHHEWVAADVPRSPPLGAPQPPVQDALYCLPPLGVDAQSQVKDTAVRHTDTPLDFPIPPL